MMSNEFFSHLNDFPPLSLVSQRICDTKQDNKYLFSGRSQATQHYGGSVLFFRHFTGNCLQRIAGFWSWAHFAPKLGHFCPKVRLISSWSLAILLKFKQIIANIGKKIAGFWSWANFAPKLGHFCPEVRLILPLKLGSKCWKNNTGQVGQLLVIVSRGCRGGKGECKFSIHSSGFSTWLVGSLLPFVVPTPI